MPSAISERLPVSILNESMKCQPCGTYAGSLGYRGGLPSLCGHGGPCVTRFRVIRVFRFSMSCIAGRIQDRTRICRGCPLTLGGGCLCRHCPWKEQT